MKIRRSKILALSVAMAMLVGMAACSGGSPNASPTPSEAATEAPVPGGAVDGGSAASDTGVNHDEFYDVTVFSQTSNYAGEQPGWFAKILKDKFNMGWNIIASNLEGETKFATMMAAGDLGEMIRFGDTSNDYLDAINAKLLMDWEASGLLSNYGKDISQNFPDAIDYQKKMFGNGTALYGLGHSLSFTNEGPSEADEFVWGPYLRWDLYEKLGYPKITNMADYLPVLKQMQDLEPTTPDGSPVYAFSIWSDWDSVCMSAGKQYASVHGYNDDTGSLLLVHASEPKYQDILQADGYYMEALKFYYQANQMGLVDPDSLTQTFSDVSTKVNNGQVLFSWFNWLRGYNTKENMNAGKGLLLVPFENEKVYSYGNSTYGGGRTIAIGAKARYPERIMELYDWAMSEEGMQTIANGPEGLTWTMNNGRQELTDFGLKVKADSQTVVPDEWGGGAYIDGQNQFFSDYLAGSAVSPVTGETYNSNYWAHYLEQPTTKALDAWRAHYGVKTSVEYFTKNDDVAIKKALFTGEPVQELPSDLNQMLGNISTIIKTNSYKMVFAKDEAEFDQLYADMVEKCNGMGYDEVKAWYVQSAEKEFQQRAASN